MSLVLLQCGSYQNKDDAGSALLLELHCPKNAISMRFVYQATQLKLICHLDMNGREIGLQKMLYQS